MQLSLDEKINLIKTQMPKTYEAIKLRAGHYGQAIFGHVRKALAGQPNYFYAIENGYVMGTPFQKHSIQADVAATMVQFETSFVVIFKIEGDEIGKN